MNTSNEPQLWQVLRSTGVLCAHNSYHLGFVSDTMLSAGTGAAPSSGFKVTVGLKLLGLDIDYFTFYVVSSNTCLELAVFESVVVNYICQYLYFV
jgi:hypothetical protein